MRPVITDRVAPQLRPAAVAAKTVEWALRLEIVVSPTCVGCEEARLIAEEVRARFPSLDVDLIEIGKERPPPPNVFATPTYLLDGTVVSLGNPKRDALISTIGRRLKPSV